MDYIEIMRACDVLLWTDLFNGAFSYLKTKLAEISVGQSGYWKLLNIYDAHI